MNNELYHFGIMGMKWGVRRYQNPDGTRTPEGKRRYSSGKVDVKSMSDEELRKAVNRKNLEKRYKELSYTKTPAAAADEQLSKNAANLMRNIGTTTKNLGRTNDVRNLGKQWTATANNMDSSYTLGSVLGNKLADRISESEIGSLSDKELQKIVDRLDLENQYMNSVKPNKTVTDRINDVLSIAVPLSAVLASTAAVYKTFHG